MFICVYVYSGYSLSLIALPVYVLIDAFSFLIGGRLVPVHIPQNVCRHKKKTHYAYQYYVLIGLVSFLIGGILGVRLTSNLMMMMCLQSI